MLSDGSPRGPRAVRGETGRRRARVIDPSEAKLPRDVADLVRDLRSARAEEDAAKARPRSLVQQLFAAGVSWSVIGWCVGISREMARRRIRSDRLL